ncbi:MULTISPECIES: hypothetical protein [Chelativorans]|jgi:hypothetical protein|uniref:hypothetical protein n=1 Tax=Chelativorans TaxID=449972 RepID=UPI00003A3935|nr:MULTISPECIES: hypothetical protein [Chelativorans]
MPLRPDRGRVAGRPFRFEPAPEDLADAGGLVGHNLSPPAPPLGDARKRGREIGAMGQADAGTFGDILCAWMVKGKAGSLVTDGPCRLGAAGLFTPVKK